MDAIDAMGMPLGVAAMLAAIDLFAHSLGETGSLPDHPITLETKGFLSALRTDLRAILIIGHGDSQSNHADTYQ